MSSSPPVLRLAAAREANAVPNTTHRLRTRVRHLESTIRTFLFSNALTRAQRRELIEILAGLRTVDRRGRAGAMTPTETRLVTEFRAMTPTNQRSLLHLAGVLARMRTGVRGEEAT